MTKIKQADLPPGVAAITRKGQAVVYNCDPGLFQQAFRFGAAAVPSVSVTVRARQVGRSAEVEGRRRPLSRDDLAVWFEEARRTLKADKLPPEFFQIRGATSAWPEIVRGRAEIDAAEWGRRELAMAERRGQTDRSPMPRTAPTSAEITRMTLCLGWAMEIKNTAWRTALLYRLCGLSFEAIGERDDVSHEAIRKRYAKGLDDIWKGLSTSAPIS